MEISQEESTYLKANPSIEVLIRDILRALKTENITDPIEAFRVIEGCRRRHSLSSQQEVRKPEDASDLMDTNEEEEAPEPDLVANRYAQNRGARRGAISSEPVASEDFEEKLIIKSGTPKSAEIQRQLEEAVKNNLLFVHLESEEKAEVFSAMDKIDVKGGEVIIRQGDEGDYFYIVGLGSCEVWKQDKPDEPAKCVMKVRQWDSFGELALIYNTPRAATVKAVTDCSLWRIDRVTYRRIIMGAQMKKRKLYDSFLEKVPILHTLQKYERLTVADALEPAVFTDGEVIIREGEPGETFYIIVEGQVVVSKQTDGGAEQEVARLYSSSYFGEIALLTDRPRAATVRAVGNCKCVKLDRDRFVRVMGPCEDILRRNMSIYNQYLSVNI